MSDLRQSRLSKAALASFILGASSLVLSLATALPALFLGVQAIRQINRGDGQLHGRRLAIAGLALSAVVTAVTVLGLLGLVLILVQEAYHLAGCSNNLRQIGQAVQNYSEHNNHYFPPGTVLNTALNPRQRLSWQAALLPYLSPGEAVGKKADKPREELVNRIAFEAAWDAPANAGLRWNVSTFLCPTFARELSPGQIGLTSYVGLAGVGDDAAALPLTDANAGFFGYDRLLRASDISARLDATMTVIETMQDNGLWPAGGPPTVRGVQADSNRYVGKDAAFGGLHRQGANILWADGSVRLVTEKIDPDLFRSESRIGR
jgi:prepilin-type processing-associated H-X9-DG protein